MLSGIYCIKCKENGKIYVGRAKNLTSRWGQHLNDLQNNKHCNNALQEDFNKYGVIAFEYSILEVVTDTQKEIFVKEREWGDKLKVGNPEIGYNAQDFYDKDLSPDKKKERKKESPKGRNKGGRKTGAKNKEHESWSTINKKDMKLTGETTISNLLRVKVAVDCSASGALVYFCILAHKDRNNTVSNLTIETISRETQISKRKITDLLNILEEKGYIKSIPTAGGRKTNTYLLAQKDEDDPFDFD